LELSHHGVKGMHWGVRRFQNVDGSLTSAGKKRYAQKGFTEDAYNSNKTKAGKAYDRITGAHKHAGKIQYDLSTPEERNKRAERYASDLGKKSHNKSQIKDPRDYSRVAVAVLPTKSGKQYSNGQYALNAAVAMIGTSNLGGLASSIAYSRGHETVSHYIDVGVAATNAAIIGGTAGKIAANNYRDRKDRNERYKKMYQ